MSNDIALLSEAVYALRENFTTVAVDRGINFDKEAGHSQRHLHRQRPQERLRLDAGDVGQINQPRPGWAQNL